jgi:hypothetical protein
MFREQEQRNGISRTDIFYCSFVCECVCVCVFEFREPISNTGNGRSEKRAKNVKVDRTVQESSLLFCFSSLFYHKKEICLCSGFLSSFLNNQQLIGKNAEICFFLMDQMHFQLLRPSKNSKKLTSKTLVLTLAANVQIRCTLYSE